MGITNSFKHYLLLLLIQILILHAGVSSFSFNYAMASDPWRKLPDAVKKDQLKEEGEKYDPWKDLRRVILPFTESEEEEAVKDVEKRVTFSKKLYKPLSLYYELIMKCSEEFSLPPEIIGAVIMVESGGNPKASSTSSSAKGLMQTVDSTFQEARKNLQKGGIQIKDNPFNPKSSIYAGSWYLNYVFEKAKEDNHGDLNRRRIEDWCLPAKYYYAGPNDGKKRKAVIIKYIDGKKIVVDKATYCQKVMHYAMLLKGSFG